MAAGRSGMDSQVRRGALHSTHEERWETNQCIFLTVDMGIEVTRQGRACHCRNAEANPANEELKMTMSEIASIFRIGELFRVVAILVAPAAVPAAVFAQADEIQVYDGSIAASSSCSGTSSSRRCSHGKRSRRAWSRSCRIGFIRVFQFSKESGSIPITTRRGGAWLATWLTPR